MSLPATAPGRVLVTGASRGIGRAIALALAARGARVVGSGRDRDALARWRAEAGDRAVAIPADLAVPEDRERLIAEATAALGGLDALVCAAGVVKYARLGAITAGDVAAQLAINLVAPLFLCQAAAPHLRRERGAIVLLSSTLARRSAPGTAVYAAGKAGLESLTRSLAVELAPEVRVNAVAPGVIDTEMIRQPRLVPGEEPPRGEAREARIESELENLRSLHPLGRLGRPDEVAAAALHLLAAPFTTGAVLTVDGGLLAG